MRGAARLVLALLACTGGVARAADVGEHVACDKYLACTHRVEVRAARGERDDLAIAEQGQSVRVSDLGVPLVPRSGACTADGSHEVVCSVAAPYATSYWNGFVQVDAGDMDDQVDASGLSAIPAVLNGGPGADRLTGGAVADELTGGPGNDALAGGAGNDLVSYADHHRPVDVDLATGETTSGGELDVLSHVEDVRGGSSDDRLVGDGGSNALAGGPGDDLLRGEGGDDFLAGETGASVLDGGPGDDVLGALTDEMHTGGLVEAEGAGPDRYLCGSGTDRAERSGARPIIGATCENLELENEIDTTRLVLDRCDAAEDEISIPLSFPGAPFRLTAALTHRGRVLGSVRRRVVRDYDPHHAVLRLSRAGLRFARTHRAFDVRLRLRQVQAPPDGFRYRESIVLRFVAACPRRSP